MPAPMSATPFAANAATAASPATAGAPRDAQPAGKGEFERLVRRPDAREAPASRQAKTPVAGSRDAQAPDAAKEPSTPRTGRSAPRAQSDPPITPTAPTAVASPDAAMLPHANDAADPDRAVLVDPLGNPLLGIASPAPAAPDLLTNGSGAPASALPVGTPLPEGMAGMPVAAPDVPADVPAAAAPDAAAAPRTGTETAAAATHEAPAKAPLQNLLSFAAHLATGQAAAAIPDAIALGRDAVDALRQDEGDAPAPTNAPAGIGAANAPLGLARTATVNPAEAPSADLHGGRFDQEIGDSVRWMADQKIGHAHIRITPHDLGTVEVRLRLDGDRVHADFASPQPEVRQALENSLPRLREMLGQHGFQLAHADVGQQHSPPSHGSGQERAGSDGTTAAQASASDIDLPRPVRMTALGLLDAYA